jgi:hypothetical protein
MTNYDSKSIWKEAAVSLKTLCQHLFEGTKENTENTELSIAGLRIEI